METVTDYLFIYLTPKALQIVTAAMKLKDLAPWKKNCDKTRQDTKKQSYHFADKGPYSQSYGFSTFHVDVRVGP